MADVFTPSTSPLAANNDCQVALGGAPGTTGVGARAWRALRNGTLDEMTTLGALDNLVEQWPMGGWGPLSLLLLEQGTCVCVARRGVSVVCLTLCHCVRVWAGS